MPQGCSPSRVRWGRFGRGCWLGLWLLLLASFGCGGTDEHPPGQPSLSGWTAADPRARSLGDGEPGAGSTSTVRQVVVSPVSPKLARGLRLQFRATAILTDGTSQDVTTVAAWSVKDTRGSDVVSIDPDGLVTADNLGQARVAARYNLTTGATLLEVTPAALTALSLNPATASIAKGTPAAFTATGEFSDGSTEDVTARVSFSVSDVMGSGVAAIDASGVALGLAAGVASVRAELSGITATARLTVTAATATSLQLRPSDVSISKGLTQRFTALAGFSDGTTQDVSTVAAWDAIDVVGFAVARIDRTGLATGDRVGKARITCNFGGRVATTMLEVKAAIPLTLTLTPMLSRVAKGRVTRFQAILNYSDGSTTDVSDAATWQVSDRMGVGVAVLSGARRGDVLAAAVGSAEVRADYGALVGRAELLVDPAVMDALSVLPEDASIAIGANQTFVAMGTYSDGTQRDVSTLVSWSSVDLGSTLGVATVGGSGVATGKLRGLAEIGAQYVGLRARAVLAVGLPAGDCAPLAWCWRNPTPHGDAHTGVFAADGSNIWTVSQHGLVTHYDGSRFRVQAAVPGQRLTAISGRDRSHVTVVGEDDLVLRFDGSTWRRDSGSGRGAAGVWESASGNLWVGGSENRIRTWNGTGWSTASPPTAAATRFRAVHGKNDNNVWAAGDNHSVAHWDGMSWRDRSITAASELVGIFAIDASSVFAAAGDGFIWQWNGSSWSFPIGSSRGLRAIAGADARSILAVGERELLWYDGSTWKSVSGTLDETLNAVHALDARSFFTAGERGSFYTWNGSSYTRRSQNLFDGRSAVNAIWGSDPRHVWAVGGAGRIVKWDGSVLTTQTSSTSVNLFAVWGSDDSHVWATGQNGTIRFFDGTRWNAQASGTLQYLNGVCGSGPSDVWAVGSNGIILHWNGTSWGAVSSPTWAELLGIWCYSATNVWAVGEDGAIIRWDGTSWQAVPSGTPERLIAIHGLNSTDIWVVGALGLVRHYDGMGWSTIPTSGPSLDLLTVWAADPTRVYMAGEGGRLLLWDGRRLIDKSRDTTSTATLRSLRGFDLRNFWAGGDDGTLLQYAP